VDSKKLLEECCAVIDENQAQEYRQVGFDKAYGLLVSAIMDDINRHSAENPIARAKSDEEYFTSRQKCYRQVREQIMSVSRKLNKKYPVTYFTDLIAKPFPEDYDRMTDLLMDILTRAGTVTDIQRDIERELLKPMVDMRALNAIVNAADNKKRIETMLMVGAAVADRLKANVM
jgi:hypothetical protein